MTQSSETTESSDLPEADEAIEATDSSETIGDEAPASAADATPSSPSSGLATAAAAITGAALGLASLTGTWLGDLMSQRKELIGNIDAASGTPKEQIEAIYGTPWHTIALYNGAFAVAAVVITAIVLVFALTGQKPSQPATWVKAVAVAGLVLGVIGLLIAGAMYFDVFTDLPSVPEQPATPAPQ